MAEVYHLDIHESEAELKKLLTKEKTGSGKERIQLLYISHITFVFQFWSILDFPTKQGFSHL